MKKYDIGILTLPVEELTVGRASITPLSNLINIFSHFSNVNLVAGKVGYDFFKDNDSVVPYLVKTTSHKSRLKNIFEFIFNQFRLSYHILIMNNIDCWVFFIGGETFLIPMIFAKIIKKKVIIIFSGSTVQTLEASNDRLSKIAKNLSTVNCTLSDRIVVYSKSLIKSWKLNSFNKKISVKKHNIINTNKFKIKKEYKCRTNIIGYVGRFSNEKGILNLLKSREKILEQIDDATFLIIGDGPLKENIDNHKDSVLNEKTELINWVNHDELSEYLNEMKILLIPSYTEGLPNIMLESMACGTPVLANSVGSIPDIIIEGKNGFLLKNNDPNTISEKVINLLKNSNLDLISKNGYEYILKNFNTNTLIQEWEDLFDLILK